MIRAREAWRATHEPALRVEAGERLAVGRRDDEWPGWVWCENAAGLGGWLPEEVVGGGRALAAFDARELTVAAGEALEPGERCAGWTWCRGARGAEGWVPDRCLGEREAPASRASGAE